MYSKQGHVHESCKCAAHLTPPARRLRFPMPTRGIPDAPADFGVQAPESQRRRLPRALHPLRTTPPLPTIYPGRERSTAGPTPEPTGHRARLRTLRLDRSTNPVLPVQTASYMTAAASTRQLATPGGRRRPSDGQRADRRRGDSILRADRGHKQHQRQPRRHYRYHRDLGGANSVCIDQGICEGGAGQ